LIEFKALKCLNYLKWVKGSLTIWDRNWNCDAD